MPEIKKMCIRDRHIAVGRELGERPPYRAARAAVPARKLVFGGQKRAIRNISDVYKRQPHVLL